MPKRSTEQRLSRIQKLAAFDERMLLKAGSSPQHVSMPSNPPNPLPVRIAGFDEAGRGALAGPVVVGCVHFPFFFRETSSPDASVASELVSDVALAKDNSQSPDPLPLQSLDPSILRFLSGLDDSKRLTRRQREELFPRIKAHAVWGVGAASAAEIDKLGIVPAVSLAARRAYRAMGINVALLLCDRGITVLSDSEIERLSYLTPQPPNTPISQSTELSFTRGDSRSLHIAAASILAKVTRDQMMVDLDQHFPGYDFAKHKGYGTASHIAALRELGPSAIHRRSFHVKLGLRGKD